MRKTPKKAIHPLVYEHDTVLQAIGGVFVQRSRLLFGRRGANLPSEMAYCGLSPCKRGEAEAQLGESHSRSDEPRRVGCGKPPQVRTCHP